MVEGKPVVFVKNVILNSMLRSAHVTVVLQCPGSNSAVAATEMTNGAVTMCDHTPGLFHVWSPSYIRKARSCSYPDTDSLPVNIRRYS